MDNNEVINNQTTPDVTEPVIDVPTEVPAPVVEQPVEETPAVDQTPEVTVEQTSETPAEPATQAEPNSETTTGEKKKTKLPIFIGIGVVAVIGIILLVLLLTGKKYTITFDTDGGSKIASVTVKKGKTVPKPKDPEKEDYTFVEWQLDGHSYYFDEKVTGDITLKAKWEIHLTDELFTITFDTRGGTEVESQSINGNGQVVKPEEPTKPHYKFKEWQLDGETYDFDSLVKKDITLTATWEMLPTHSVKVEYDGGGRNYNQEVYEGDQLTKPDEPEKEGYKFVEWQKDGQKYNFETPVVEDFTLTAKYEELKKYKVTFKDKDNTISSTDIFDGQTVSKPSDPKKDGYEFAGWYSDSELTKVYDFRAAVTKDTTIYAKWTEVKKCTVRLYDINTGEIFKLEVDCGTKITRKQVLNTIKSDCIKTYGEDKATICCGNGPGLLEYYDIENDKPAEKKFDYNTIIDKDISLGFTLGRGVLDDGNGNYTTC